MPPRRGRVLEDAFRRMRDQIDYLMTVEAAGRIAGPRPVWSVPTAGSGGVLTFHGRWAGFRINAVNEVALGTLMTPPDFDSLTNAFLWLIPNGTGTLDWTMLTSRGVAGEDEQANQDSTTANAEPMTDDELTRIDVTAAFNLAAANNAMGWRFRIDALTITEIFVMAVEWNYETG